MTETVISFKHFGFQYYSQAEPTLHDINLEIHKGEKILIAGPSGSGKSTLGHCMNGLIPFAYRGTMTGTLTVAGLETKSASLFELSQKIGTVLQDSDGQFIGLDHEVPLGANGISLSDYSGKEVQPVAAPSETSAASTDAETTPDPYETEVLPSTGALEENAVSTTADRMFVVAIVLIGTAGLAAVIVIVFTIIKKRKMSENNK